MRACFCATVSPGFVLRLLFGVRVGVPAFVGTVVWFERGEGVWPEARFLCRVGAIFVVICLDAVSGVGSIEG